MEAYEYQLMETRERTHIWPPYVGKGLEEAPITRGAAPQTFENCVVLFGTCDVNMRGSHIQW